MAGAVLVRRQTHPAAAALEVDGALELLKRPPCDEGELEGGGGVDAAEEVGELPPGGVDEREGKVADDGGVGGLPAEADEGDVARPGVDEVGLVRMDVFAGAGVKNDDPGRGGDQDVSAFVMSCNGSALLSCAKGVQVLPRCDGRVRMTSGSHPGTLRAGRSSETVLAVGWSQRSDG